jgi:hypothetical protein
MLFWEVQMANRIEKMTRMRRNILSGILIGTVIAFCLDLSPTIYSIFHFNRISIVTWKNHLFYSAVVLWLLTILLFITRYWLYKRKLKKDPSLHTAVYDERAKLNWLKACRFAFFAAISLTIIWKSCESFFSRWLLELRFTLPDGPFLVLWGAVIALVGSFLYYNQEAKNE